VYKGLPFELFWNTYNKKVGDKTKIERKWKKLANKDQETILDYLPKYITATPDKKFRKNPETFLNNKSWKDEIITGSNGSRPKQISTKQIETI
jgi:hypothetical protein